MEMFNSKLLLLFLSLTGISFVTGKSTCTRLLDVIAVVDGSDSLTPEDFSSLKTSLVKFAEWLELGDGSQRFGAVVYSSGVTDTAPLSSDFDGLKTQISAFDHPADGTHTHTGIKKMKEMFENNRREGVPMVAIVITDGRSKNPSATLAAAKEAKDLGVKMIAVGVGTKVNQGELSGFATSQADVKQISNFNQLQALVPTLVKKYCIVDGGWSDWTPPTESTCSLTFGTGTKILTYTRTCTNPVPKNGGENCQGSPSKTETEACQLKQCPDEFFNFSTAK